MSENCQLVVFSNKAYNALIRESFDKDPVETGGILLGHVLDNGVWIVMEVLPPGIKSIFQYAYFEYDEAFVNYLAQSVANQYKRPLDLLGLWHRHPGSMDFFSSTDDGTNATFARQNPAGVISGLVNIDPQFRLTMYHLDCPNHRIVGRPDYEVIDVEVGDDIIPEEYFELRYFNGCEADLHPMVESRGQERQISKNLHDDTISERERVTEPEENNSDGMDIQGIISRNLPPYNVSHNPTPKPINDFFSFWRGSKKKWIYALLAVIALITFVCTIRTCKHVYEGVSTWVSDDSEDKAANTKENEEETSSLSVESIKLTQRGASEIISLRHSKGKADWTSSNPKVAEVKDGKVTAISNGTTIVKAFIGGKGIGSCKVVVDFESTEPETEKETDSSKTTTGTKDSRQIINAIIDTQKTYKNQKSGDVKIGSPFVLPIIISGNPSPEVTYKSSNPEVATIDGNGSVKTIKKGSTVITIFCNGKPSDTFTLNVKEK